MGMELQGLIDRINTEGLEKAENQRSEIIRQAEAQAKEIAAQAKKDAAALLKEAQIEADKLEQRAKSAVQQAARDILYGLRTELNARLAKLVKATVTDAMTPDAMLKIILALIPETQGANGDSALEIALSKVMNQDAVNQLIASLTANLKVNPEITLRSDFAGGLKLGVKGSDLFADLSDEAITDLVSGYVGPKIAAILEA